MVDKAEAALVMGPLLYGAAVFARITMGEYVANLVVEGAGYVRLDR